MKAIVCTKYGPPEVLQLKEVEKPVPGDNEVLIKIHETAVTASDCIVRGFKLPVWHPMGFMMGLVLGFKRPRNSVLGMVFAGEIESIGKSVKGFREGDQVCGSTVKPPKIRFGAYAEYLCLSEDSLITLKPSNVTYENAAAVIYGAGLALYFLKKGNVHNIPVSATTPPGKLKILIYGASGAIGTMAVQFAKYFGAEVTGVCSTANMELVRSLGADTVIDYTKENLLSMGEFYDFIFDAVGKKKSSTLKSACKKVIAPGGKYISVDSGSPKNTVEELHWLMELVSSGKIKPVIDRVYPLEQIVEAHRYVDKGHKKGNVIISIRHNNNSDNIKN